MVAVPSAIVFLTGSTALGAFLLVVIRVWMACRPTGTPHAEADEFAIENTLAYRRLLEVASWSGGSRREWEHRIRPVLNRLVEPVTPHLIDEDLDLTDLLGQELSDLMQESDDLALDGSLRMVDQGALVAILDRLDLDLESVDDEESGLSSVRRSFKPDSCHVS